MRVNNINMALFGRTAGISSSLSTPSFGSREIYDWTKEGDFLPGEPQEQIEQGDDKFIPSTSPCGSDDELFYDDIQKLFEKRDKNSGEAPVTLKIGGNNKKGSNAAFVVKTASLAAAFYLIGTLLLSNVPLVGDAIRDSAKQAELERRFKDNPEAVAMELVSALGLDEAAVESAVNPFSEASFSSVMTGKMGEEFIEGLPLGPKSELGYGIDGFITVPGTVYSAVLDIDGDDNPEIGLLVPGSGYVDIFYDHNSDGLIDEHVLYNAFGGTSYKAETPSLDTKELANTVAGLE